MSEEELKPFLDELLSILIISLSITPYVYADTVSALNLSNNSSNIDSSRITILENTNTSQIILVGNIQITIKCDVGHTNADMQIKNLVTSETANMNFKITHMNNVYKIDMYTNGTLINTSISSCDPLQPGIMTGLKSQASNIKNTQSLSPLSFETYNWDNITYSNSGRYPHPDYVANNIIIQQDNNEFHYDKYLQSQILKRRALHNTSRRPSGKRGERH